MPPSPVSAPFATRASSDHRIHGVGLEEPPPSYLESVEPSGSELLANPVRVAERQKRCGLVWREEVTHRLKPAIAHKFPSRLEHYQCGKAVKVKGADVREWLVSA